MSVFSEPAVAYLRAHAIDPDLAERVGVRERNRTLLLPYGVFERRRPLRGSRTLQPAGAQLRLWWPAGRAAPGAEVLLCEGEPDALAALSAFATLDGQAPVGPPVVAALPGTGTPVATVVNELRGVSTVTLALDGDDAGRKCAAKLTEALGKAGVRVQRIDPPDGRDLADMLVTADDRGQLLANLLADAQAAEGVGVDSGNSATPRSRSGDADGAAFALDAPETIAAIWGSGTSVLWPEGEPVMLYGPDGVGKTTVMQQLVCRRIGIGAPQLLEQPVAVTEAKVLYLALDRPLQAARSMRRMLSERDRRMLEERLSVWRGSLPFDVTLDPDSLARFAVERGARTVFIDSLKDLVPKLSDEDTGCAVHRAWQICVEQGIEVMVGHHPRKAQADNRRPRALADVYGSRWLAAGCGSVILLWGDAGDPIVELEHLKQPADVVGPMTLLHDNRAGTTVVVDSSDVVQLVAAHASPATVADIARGLFRTTDPGRNEIEKARRRLESEVERNRLQRLPADPGDPARYVLAERVTQDGHGGSR